MRRTAMPGIALSLATLALGAGCDPAASPTGPAQSPTLAVTSNEVVRDFADVAISDCTGEAIDVVGTEHTVFSVTVTGSGRALLGFHFNALGTGTRTATGEHYVVHATVNDQITINDVNQTQTETYPYDFAMIGQGGAPDQKSHALFHITRTPDGSVTAYLDNFRTSCGL